MEHGEEGRFARWELLAGAENLRQLGRIRILIAGVGGVGSFAVEALARAGIGHLVLVDPDVICRSNLNRQIHALEETIGRPKVEVMAERCLAINPGMRVTMHQIALSAANAAELLDGELAAVLDCVDTISAKIQIMTTCHARGIPVFSAMGFAEKLDPCAITVSDLFETSNCRMARVLRKELRRRGIYSGVTAVVSTEQSIPRRPAEPTPVHGPWQRPALGSTSWVPPMAGLTMAGTVIRRLLKIPNEAGPRNSEMGKTSGVETPA
ncbi:MAG: tRNA threonylcarbamoyladenosine dehydratase [bacterium]|nr:tRNA threonylcarbamoyladenosine dehydratase [bacterium]